MSEAQHTRGPWKMLEHSWSDTSIVAEGFDHGICRLDINHATEESQDADAALMAANARLIATAPELLEALQEMVEFFQPNAWGSNDNKVDALASARAAIAKATGQPT